MSSQVSICLCPFEPNIATAEDLVLSVSAPYSEKQVTLTINPNITGYIKGKSEGGLHIAQLIESRSTDETVTVKLDVQQHPEQLFAYGGKLHSVRFMGTIKKSYEVQEFLCFNFFVETLELTDVQKEGTAAFTLSHEHGDWMANKHGYNFQPLYVKGILLQPFKDPDGTFRISINGPLGHSLTFRQDVSEITTPKLHVAVTWKDTSVKLYLNSQLATEKQIEVA